ncbi:glycosyltransferase family 2 protein [Novosphingobium sp.]|uniref:glycosyltransferase family 2 protein n=1 Tax=Novosphingobium sp. TaxID=1874826 RepID=UPI00261F1BDF|nr:glycosyltransferase family 2 protein [Novosphingobium sp.]
MSLLVSATSIGVPQVSVLVVAFNSLEHIGLCLRSVFAAAGSLVIEVLLIDNGVDGTASFVARSFPEVTLIPSRGNIGFGAGNNELARHARAPLLLLLNPDMVVSPDAIAHLFALSRKQPDAAAWGGVTLSEDGSADVANHLRFPRLRDFPARLAFQGDRAAAPERAIGSRDTPVELVTGGFVMISRAVWHELCGFDERFFLYCEESDLFLRARKAGRVVWRTPRATAIHFTGSGNSLAAPRLLYQATGLSQFMHKHWPWPKAWAGVMLFWLIALERYLLGCLAGWFWRSAGRVGTAYRLVTLHPQRWMRGYASAYWVRRLGRGEVR